MKGKSYKDSKRTEIFLAKALSQQNVQKQSELERLQKELVQLRAHVDSKLALLNVQLEKIAQQSPEETITIPVSAFKTNASSLEVVVAYLKNTQQMTIAAIARLLNRDHRTIWHAYQRHQKKCLVALHHDVRSTSTEILIPVIIFAERKNSPLEALVAYVHDTHHLQFAEIGRMLLLSRKTIWTVYQRYQRNNAQ